MYSVPKGQFRADAFLPERHQRVSVSMPFFSASCTLLQKEARHILINYKGDAAGGSDTNHVGYDAFVEASGAFIPADKGKKMTQNGHYFVLETETRVTCSAPFLTGSVSLPPCPSDDIKNSIVSIVLVLQASSHHLIRVCCDHSKYF